MHLAIIQFIDTSSAFLTFSFTNQIDREAILKNDVYSHNFEIYFTLI